MTPKDDGSVPFQGYDVSYGWTQESPTAALQFVQKADGKMILQQKWSITSPTQQTFVWRDVPVCDEVHEEAK